MHTVPVDTTTTDGLLQAIPGIVLVVAAGQAGASPGCITFANRALLDLLGVTAGQIVGRSWPAEGDVTPNGPPARLALATPAGERTIEWSVRTWLAGDGATTSLWVGRDVTHEPVPDPNQLLARVGDNMFDAQLLLSVEPDGQYRIRAANRRYLEILRARGFAVSEAELIGKTREELVAELGIQPESRDHAGWRYREAIRTRQAVRYQASFQFGDALRHVETSIAPVFDAGGRCTHLVRTTRNLTDQVNAERALRVSEARLLEAQTVARVGCWEVLFPQWQVAWTEQVFRICELDPLAEPASYARFLAVVHPDDRELLQRSFEASLADRLPYHLVHRLVMPDGRIKWVDERCATEYGPDGQPARAIGTIQDITERIVAEQALGESRIAYRQLDAVSRLKDRAIEASINAIVFTDLDGAIGYVNRSFLRMWGFASDAAVLGRSAWQFYADPEAAADAWQHLRTCGDWVGELVAKRLDGAPFNVLLSATVIRDDHGQPAQLMASIVDVSARAHAEEDLRRTRDLLRTVIDSSPDGIFVKDPAHRFLLVNEAFAAIAGTRPEAMVGHFDADFWDHRTVEGEGEARGFRSDDRLALAGDIVRNDRALLHQADGALRVFTTVKRPLWDRERRVYGILGYTRDITEQVAADERIRRSLDEKEILLREVHHRVKNNLQIVSSLLHFQAKRVQTPDDRAAFEDGRKRLLAMILVHDRLYQSEDLTSVEFGSYARSLVSALVATFEQSSRIRVAMETDDLRLPAELALPSGLMLCELVTNVFKYGYPGDRSGTLRIAIMHADVHVMLTVHDDGVGFPAGFDARTTTTFGWHLVNTLALQLDATIDAGNDDGARVRIRYPIPERRKAPWSHPSTNRL